MSKSYDKFPSEDMELYSIKRIEKIQNKKLSVSFSVPNTLARMLTEEEFPVLYQAMKWTLDLSSDKDFIAFTRPIPFKELILLKTFITELVDDDVKSNSRGLLRQLTSIIELVVNGKKRKVGYLKNLPTALFAFLEDGYIDGWLYKMDDDGNALPSLVTHVEYVLARYKDDRPYVVINTIHYSYGKRIDHKMIISANDISGRTVSNVLYSEGGFLHETPSLKKSYLEGISSYNKFVKMNNCQFTVKGIANYENSMSHNIKQDSRALNDEASRESFSFNLEADNMFWISSYDAEEGSYSSVPVHPFVYMFHFGLHQHMWVSSKNIKVYEYDKSIGDKLILPESHKELINILTSDSDILMEDIIEGKGAGTIILCKGIPGVGKTLTAQVYSEVIGRPLYSVNAGQLGTTVQEVEKTLKLIISRAERWNAVLLIDEADIYIRTRGDDVHHNALVAVWLRIIEYFNGLMFLTTNRGDDVDDAISSRCIATIAYTKPSHCEAVSIWRIMCNSASLDLSDDDYDKLARTFPDAVGRDIEKLVRLTSRFLDKKKEKVSIESFVHCSAFRGMTSVNV